MPQSSYTKTIDLIWTLIKDKKFVEAETKVDGLPIGVLIGADKKRALSAKGLVKENAGKWDEAVTIYTQAVKEFPTLLNATLSLSRCYQKQHRYDQSEKVLKAFPNYQTEYKIQMALAYIHSEQGEYPKAIQLFKGIASSDKEVKLGLSRAYQGLEQYTESEKCLKEISANQQKDEQVLHAYGCLYTQNGKHEMALQKFKEIPNYDKKRDVLISLGRLFNEKTDYTQAEKCYKSVTKWESDPLALLGLGRCYMEQGLNKDAISTYKKIAYWQTDLQLVIGIARCLDALGDHGQAIELLEKLPENKRNPDFYMTLALFYQTIEDHAKAKACYEQIKPSQTSKKVKFSRAACYSSSGNVAEALTLYQEILKDGYDKNSILSIAHCYQVQKQYQKAREYVKQVKNWEEDVEALLRLASIEEALQNNEEAINLLTGAKNWQTNPTLCYAVAKYQSNLKNYHQAVQLVKALPWRDDKKAITCISSIYAKANNFAEEIKINEIATKKWPEDRLFRLNLGIAYVKNEEYSQALPILESVHNWRKDKRVLLAHAHCLEKLGRFEEAGKEFQTINSQWPGQDVTASLARFYQATKQYEMTLKEFKKLSDWRGNKMALMGIGHCYKEMGDIDQAFAHFKKINGWQNDPEIINTMAIYYADTGDYETAEKYFQSCPDWKTNRDILIGLIRVYSHTNNEKIEEIINLALTQFPEDRDIIEPIAYHYQSIFNNAEAIRLLEGLPASKRNNSVKMSLSISYQEVGNFAKAIECHKQLEIIDNDKSALMSHAILQSKLGFPAEAIEILKSHPQADSDPEILISMARMYDLLNNPVEAENAIKRISNWHLNRIALLTLGHTYKASGNYNESIATFKKITNWKNDTSARLGIAYSYRESDSYVKARHHYQKIKNWSRNRRAVLGVEECYRLELNFDESERVIRAFPNWQKEKSFCIALIKTLVNRAKYYEEYVQLNEVEVCLQQFPQWDENCKILLTLARAHEEQGEMITAARYYKKVMELFPDDYDVQISYGLFLIITGGEFEEVANIFDALIEKFPDRVDTYLIFSRILVTQERYEEATHFINNAIKKFPFTYNLQISRARLQCAMGEMVQAIATTMETIEQYPLVSTLRLHLIRLHIINDDMKSARKCFNDAKQLFKDNDRLERKGNNLFKNAALIRMAGNKGIAENYVDKNQLPPLDFPPIVKDAFSDLKQASPGFYYLVGGAVESLINKSEMPPADLDLFALDASEERLIKNGHSASPHISNLLTKTNKNEPDKLPVDVVLAGKAYVSVNSIKTNATSRDFTIAAIYCDENGKLYDPLGRGITDCKNKILRPIGPAGVCLAKDPVRILRAMHYISHNCYTPTPDLAQALLSWKADLTPQKKQHLAHVLHKHLDCVDNKKYIETLKKYGLVEKLFGINPAEEDSLTINQLRLQAGLAVPYNGLPKEPHPDLIAKWRQIVVNHAEITPILTAKEPEIVTQKAAPQSILLTPPIPNIESKIEEKIDIIPVKPAHNSDKPVETPISPVKSRQSIFTTVTPTKKTACYSEAKANNITGFIFRKALRSVNEESINKQELANAKTIICDFLKNQPVLHEQKVYEALVNRLSGVVHKSLYAKPYLQLLNPWNKAATYGFRLNYITHPEEALCVENISNTHAATKAPSI